MKFLSSKIVTSVSSGESNRLLVEALSKIPSKKAELMQCKVGIAVSGGPDSMALAVLAKEALGADRVHALIVDHRMQKEGVSEDPERVISLLKEQGFKSCSVLPIEWPTNQTPSEAKLMMQAREERYRVLLEACQKNSLSLLLTGHNLEDDLVTMFYRIAHLSGLDGIAGMKSATNFPFPAPNSASCFILRPFLSVPKARLVETCRQSGVQWHADTSNDNLNFRRNECLQALIDLQKDNESLTTDALSGMLQFFKRQRQHLHEKVTNAMAKSVIVNQSVGDAAVVLNNHELIDNRYLMTRVLSNLVQVVTCNPYPPKTPSLNRLYDEIKSAHDQYQVQRRKEQSKLNNVSVPIKRLDLPQHTLAGATVYALSRNDSLRRLDNFFQRSGRQLAAGPALLIQREIPARKEREEMACIKVDFSQSKSFLWDGRIFIQCETVNGAETDLQFSIRPLSVETVKDFEAATKNNFSARKNLYAYLGMTPASHLHIIPVLKHEASGYMAIPTLNCYSASGRFKWSCSNAAMGLMAGKFLCSP